ncbi:BASIC PROLINE-RICH PROTEIN6 [Hibiscus trionum]|uniref:BASIC PROLINE-RICH PROTEIN6 n=1 Tax=Hibiscus trionum TaxID=183268 RepID=A0A9W7ML83_HIBTR|nr:BASIC PROLINE-RICH PROTEIN6 [Hibiscus trionum]
MMMNRSNMRESQSLLRNNNNNNNTNISAASNHHRRRLSLSGGLLFPRDSNDNLDLFSKNRSSLSLASPDGKLRRLSLGSANVKDGLVDLLSSTDGEKHDYDWLLTPPGTPFFPSSEGSKSQFAKVSLAPRRNFKVESISITKASRFSVSQSESNHSLKPTRSSSVTRPSVSSYSNYSSNSGTPILNTSSASVSSYTRPSSPIICSPSTARPSTPSPRPTSRSSTPSKVRSSPNGFYIDKSRPLQSSRASTPTSRSQIHANLNSKAVCSNSRSTTPTPTHRNSISSEAGVSPSAGRIVLNGHSAAPASRQSSPGPRVRPLQHPVVLPDFLLDTPANLRTTLPDRPISAGRSRPGGSFTMKANQDTTSSVNMPRRHSSPIFTRARLADPHGRTHVHSNGHASDIHESRKNSPVSDLAMRKPLKSSTTTADSPGFGRTISKKSVDMTIRHKDMRNGTGSIRPLSSTTLFPQRNRSGTSKTQSRHSLSASDSDYCNGGSSRLKNGELSENGNSISRAAENGSNSHDGRYSAKVSELDIYESSGYDVILLKEDLKNTCWLHSIDDTSDRLSISDSGFEPVPEPFGLL